MAVGWDAQVIVVGAGPAGATAAGWLARAGVDVLVFEKAHFPRQKVCGDGLTPRAVRELDLLGVATPAEAGWRRNRGLRVYGGGHRLELDWPSGTRYPDYGLTLPRADFDQILADQARRHGARLIEGASVTGPVLDEASGQIIGVRVRGHHLPDGGRSADGLGRPQSPGTPAPHWLGRAKRAQLSVGRPQSPGTPAPRPDLPDDILSAPSDEADPTAVVGLPFRPGHRPQAPERTYRAPFVIAADGGSARLAVAMGLQADPGRPLGVAVRAYFEAERPGDAFMESHLELWDGPPGRSNLLPGYGWVFPLAGGRLNVGLGSVGRPGRSGQVNHRELFERWLAGSGQRLGLDPSSQLGPPGSAALPMAFNRRPLALPGLMLVGDAGGMVSPFDGEGIAYAMTAGRVAAAICTRELERFSPASRQRAAEAYMAAMHGQLGGYFQLGRVFDELIARPQVMHLCTTWGLGRPALMRLVMKLLSGLYQPQGGDWMDRLIAGLARAVPAA